MRIHFSAERLCALKLGGALAGYLGETEKFADIGGAPVLAEFLPADGDLLPLSFFIDDSFFARPPACADVYRYGFGANVHVRFSPREGRMRAAAQRRFGDTLATVFYCGKAQLALENGNNFELHDLPDADGYELREEFIGKERFFCVLCRGKRQTLCLYAENLREAFCDRVSGYECGDALKTKLEFADIAGHTAVRTYRAENGALLPQGCEVRAREGFSPDQLHEKLLPFALFQEIAAGGDPSPYLAPALEERKELLKEYLGEFCGVYLPKEIFYLVHGQKNAAGLIYRRAPNAFDVKFFETESAGGKITNILPVE